MEGGRERHKVVSLSPTFRPALPPPTSANEPRFLLPMTCHWLWSPGRTPLRAATLRPDPYSIGELGGGERGRQAGRAECAEVLGLGSGGGNICIEGMEGRKDGGAGGSKLG